MVAENPNGRTMDLGRLVIPTARCASSAIGGIEPAQPNYLPTSRLPATIGAPGFFALLIQHPCSIERGGRRLALGGLAHGRGRRMLGRRAAVLSLIR